MSGRRLAASSWFIPTRSRTSRFGASATGWRSVIPRISPRVTQRRSRQAPKRRQRGDGARRLEDEISERRDAAEGREIVLATQPPELHQLEAPDLIEDRDVGDRAEAAFEPAKPGERAEPLEVDGPDRQAARAPTRRPSVSTSFHDPLTPSRRSLGRSPTARIERRFSVSPSASSSSAPATWRRPSSELSRSERAARLRRPGNQRSISRSSPASRLSWTSGRDDRSSATRGQASSGRHAVDADPRLVPAQRRQLVARAGPDPAKRVAHERERSARPSPCGRSGIRRAPVR